MLDDCLKWEISITNHRNVNYYESFTQTLIKSGQTKVLLITGSELAEAIISTIEQINELKGANALSYIKTLIEDNQNTGSTQNETFNVIQYDPALYRTMSDVQLAELTPLYGAELDTETGVLSVAATGSTKQFTYSHDTTLNSEVVVFDGANTFGRIPENGKITIDDTNLQEGDAFCMVFKNNSMPIIDDNKCFIKDILTNENITGNPIENTVSIMVYKENGLRKTYFRMETNADSWGDTWDSDSPIELNFYSTINLLNSVMGISESEIKHLVDDEVFKTYLLSPSLFMERYPDSALVLPSFATFSAGINSFSCFLTPNYIAKTNSTLTLNPSTSVQLTYENLKTNVYGLPPNAKDGDYLHFMDVAKVFGKSQLKNSFLRIYANKTKGIYIED